MTVERRLCDVLSEFARTLLTDFPVEQILDHLVQRIVDVLPVDAAGVSLIFPTNHPQLIAGSDESAIRYEQLQTSLGQGPCLAAYRADTPISIPDLAQDHRFPKFAEGALAEGLVAVFAFPLGVGDRRLGALDLYRRTPGDLDGDEMAAAQTLAAVATSYLLNARARQTQSELVATVSHELRTPLTSIHGYVELLQDDDVEGALSPQQGMFVAAIGRNGDRLRALADDLLTLSSFESGTHEPEQEEVDLVPVVLAARDTMAPTIAKRDLAATYDVPTRPVWVRGDVAGLTSVVWNLVSNAVKFTEDGGWVRCGLTTDSGRATLVVSDNGLGIPDAEQRDLFTRFFRSSTAHEHAIQGSGLGLTIVESLVKQHGGEISVRSRHLHGSTFTVVLPLATHAEQSPGTR